jgi:hypothetical protein
MSAVRVETAAFAAAILCVAIATPSQPARAVPYTCPKSNYDVDLAVVYANGMFTTSSQAQEQREALRPLIAERLGHDPHAITFDLAYNDDEETFSQLWEVAKQRQVMTVSGFLRVVSRLVPAPDWFVEETQKVASEVDLLGFTADEDLDAHVQTYRDHQRKGRKVVIVAHSQGTLYANAAHRRLFPGDAAAAGLRSFGVVSIATPAPAVAGWAPEPCLPSGCYTTFAEDLVMQAVRHAFPDTLPANLIGSVGGGLRANGDLLWHQLRESYLQVDSARERIVGHVAAFVDEFEDLEWTIHDSMITVSLEWDSDADLDLHVYENDGAEHVYYAYPAGAAGYLEADDEDGYGPENYRADCGYVAAASYRFAVGYFAGSGPTTARLRVQAGDLVQTFTRVLPAAQGRASHTEPATLAVLEVVSLGDEDYELALFADREAM